MQSGLVRKTAAALLSIATAASCASDESSDSDNMAGGAPSGVGGSTGGAGGTSNASGAPSTGGGGMAAAGSSGSGGATTVGDDGPLSFASDVWPILKANCGNVSCHGDGSFLPQHAHSDVNVAYEEAEPVADLIAGRVSGQLMPIMPQFCGPAPGLGECLSVAEVQLIQAWVAAGAPF